MKYVLNDNNEPEICADLLKWAVWYENPSNRSLAYAQVGEVRISTMFLGLDHSFGNGEPVLWGTCVFEGKYDGEEKRYTSRLDALKGHDEMVEKVKESFNE